jgi:hypothetical protein
MLHVNADPDEYTEEEISSLKDDKEQMMESIKKYKEFNKKTYGSKKDYLAPFEWKKLEVSDKIRVKL